MSKNVFIYEGRECTTVNIPRMPIEIHKVMKEIADETETTVGDIYVSMIEKALKFTTRKKLEDA